MSFSVVGSLRKSRMSLLQLYPVNTYIDSYDKEISVAIALREHILTVLKNNNNFKILHQSLAEHFNDL